MTPEGETAAAQFEAVPEQSASAPPGDVRFRIFVIDSGWNSPASKVVRENIPTLRDLNCDQELFVLSREMSIALLRYYPLQIGRDPIITVHDLKAIHRHREHHTHGFRMHLGRFSREAEVLETLRMFAKFLVTHRAAKDLDRSVRKVFHRQGLAGAIEVIGSAKHMLGE